MLQRLQRACVVFCADGTAWWPPYWITYGFPPLYARSRRQEAREAVGIAGNRHEVHFLGHPDGSLATCLPRAYRSLSELFRAWRPEHVITHAFEGGHEDHDSCSFLAATLSREFHYQTWEMPLYYRSADTGNMVRQAFTTGVPADDEITPATESELAIKESMLARHVSQQNIVSQFDPCIERFRRQPKYDYGVWPANALPRKRFGTSPYRCLRAFQRFRLPL